MTDSPRCGCDRPSHHYGSRACDRPAGPGMSFCYGCYSAGHDRLSPCAPSTARRDDHSDDHDPSGRLCALAGRRFAGHDTDDYCRLCYADLLRTTRCSAFAGPWDDRRPCRRPVRYRFSGPRTDFVLCAGHSGPGLLSAGALPGGISAVTDLRRSSR
jgi:hypothetical protein